MLTSLPHTFDDSMLSLPRHTLIGAVQVWSLSDGHFYPQPVYFGPDVTQSPFNGLFSPGGDLHDLPLGCFLLQVSDSRRVLVDAGLGPDPTRGNAGSEQYLHFECGDFPTQMAATSISPIQITDVVLTHLHLDHYGWLLDVDGRELFPAAKVWVGRADLDHFSTVAEGGLNTPMRELFDRLVDEGRLHLLESQAQVCDEIIVHPAPGHTPGHQIVEVNSEQQRLFLLGDAMNCPEQLTETSWRSVGDVDPPLAHATRAALWTQLEQPHTWGVGSHFPGLIPGSVIAAESRRWAAAPGTVLQEPIQP